MRGQLLSAKIEQALEEEQGLGEDWEGFKNVIIPSGSRPRCDKTDTP